MKCDTEIDRAEKKRIVQGIWLILGLNGCFISETSNGDPLSIVVNTEIVSAAQMSWYSVVMFACLADDKNSTSVREDQVEIGVLGSDIS